MNKTQARREAFGLLYAADVAGEPPEVAEEPARVRRFVEGVWSHRDELDARIGAVSEGWRVERMPPVDRNILRLGLYELSYTDTPTGVVISEAVEIAKTYSTARSGSFVNGVLARLARDRDR